MSRLPGIEPADVQQVAEANGPVGADHLYGELVPLDGVSLDGLFERVGDGVIADHAQRKSLAGDQNLGRPAGELREVV